ncbi:MAG: hypothetical protein ISR65_01640 [Bacteriovoracaceae bacterium]|nr:hypothetical protein [Bacteriovoracaceae bacterium]
MRNCEQGLKLYKLNKYIDAYRFFELTVNEIQATMQDKINAYQHLIDVNIVLNRAKKNTQVYLQFGDFLSAQNKFYQAAKMYEELLHNVLADSYPRLLEATKSIDEMLNKLSLDEMVDTIVTCRVSTILYKLWASTLAAGKIAQSNNYARIYLSYLVQRKYVTKGIIYIEELKKSNSATFDYSFYYLIFNIFGGDVKAINDYFLNLDKSEGGSGLLGYIGPSTKAINDFKIIEQEFDQNIEHWKDFKAIYELKLSLILMKITESPDRIHDIKIRKLFINLLLNYFIHYPDDTTGFMLAGKYAGAMSKKGILSTIKSIYHDKKELFLNNRKLCLFLEHELEGIDQMQEEELVVDEQNEDYDLATELFREDESEFIPDEDGNEEINKLARDIRFLLRTGNKQKAQSMLKTLKRLDSENTIFYEFKDLDEEEDTQVDQLQEMLDSLNEQSVDTIQQNLLNEISKYATSFDNSVDKEEFCRQQNNFIKLLQLIEKSFLLEHYGDLIICFLFLGMNHVAKEVLSIVKTESADSNDIKIILDLEYFNVVILMEENSDFDALISIDQVLSSFPLFDEEKVCFMYFKAEILKKQGKVDQSHEVFKQIEKLAPNYRMTRKRITEVEADK